MTLEPAAQQLRDYFRQAVEGRLITLVEAIEGHVPTDPELTEHGACGIHKNGKEEWRWRDCTILVAYIRWNPKIEIVLETPSDVLR